MNRIALLLVVGCVIAVPSTTSCARHLTPEEEQTVANLKRELAQVEGEVSQATAEDAEYSGGLIKALIGVRLQVLRTNQALLQQRIHSIESGAEVTIVLTGTKPDPERAATLEREIRQQRDKVAEARSYADQYSGGLVKAIAESTVATAKQTLAMLEQQYLVAKYGLALPSPPKTIGGTNEPSTTLPVAGRAGESTGGRKALGPGLEPSGAKRGESQPGKCLAIGDFDSSVLDSNDVYTELAWKADIKNTCDREFSVRVRFVIYAKNEFELDTDDETVIVPANGIGKARGKMLVSPPEKARRMARHGVQILGAH
jgi:hypothetical protein